MDKSKLSTHQVRVADLLVEALVVELDDPVDGVAQHRLELGDLLGIVVPGGEARLRLGGRAGGQRLVRALQHNVLEMDQTLVTSGF